MIITSYIYCCVGCSTREHIPDKGVPSDWVYVSVGGKGVKCCFCPDCVGLITPIILGEQSLPEKYHCEVQHINISCDNCGAQVQGALTLDTRVFLGDSDGWCTYFDLDIDSEDPDLSPRMLCPLCFAKVQEQKTQQVQP